MEGFWKLISTLIALTGFTVTGIVLLMKGATIPDVVLKAVAVFVVLYAIEKFLGGIFMSVVTQQASPDDAVEQK